MSETKTYFVTLTPLQLFFFGGEQGETADYFLKGSFQPQQTALLGLVRHQILLQNKLMQDNNIQDDTEAAKWIGEKSFEYNQTDQQFGKIHSLSPCYLVRKGQDGGLTKFLPWHQPYAGELKVLNGNYYLPDYDPKGYYPDVWKSLDTEETISNKNGDIYSEVIKPGVDKNYEGQTEEGDKAYYKQVWLKMKPGLAFGFYVEFDADVKFESAHVTFGKESSPFFMEVNDEKKLQGSTLDEANAIVLTSDAYVKEAITALADFAVTDTVPFRNIQSPTTSNTNYYKIDKDRKPENNRKYPVRLLLLKRGSIFYCKNGNMNSIKEALEAQKNFRNTGYNHYHLLNITY